MEPFQESRRCFEFAIPSLSEGMEGGKKDGRSLNHLSNVDVDIATIPPWLGSMVDRHPILNHSFCNVPRFSGLFNSDQFYQIYIHLSPQTPLSEYRIRS